MSASVWGCRRGLFATQGVLYVGLSLHDGKLRDFILVVIPVIMSYRIGGGWPVARSLGKIIVLVAIIPCEPSMPPFVQPTTTVFNRETGARELQRPSRL